MMFPQIAARTMRPRPHAGPAFETRPVADLLGHRAPQHLERLPHAPERTVREPAIRLEQASRRTDQRREPPVELRQSRRLVPERLDEGRELLRAIAESQRAGQLAREGPPRVLEQPRLLGEAALLLDRLRDAARIEIDELRLFAAQDLAQPEIEILLGLQHDLEPRDLLLDRIHRACSFAVRPCSS
jgi:hypothetical protein